MQRMIWHSCGYLRPPLGSAAPGRPLAARAATDAAASGRGGTCCAWTPTARCTPGGRNCNEEGGEFQVKLVVHSQNPWDAWNADDVPDCGDPVSQSPFHWKGTCRGLGQSTTIVDADQTSVGWCDSGITGSLNSWMAHERRLSTRFCDVIAG
jgi:hypothetical protein